MSVINGLYYQILDKTVSLGPVSGTVFYFTVPWEANATVDSVRLYSNSASNYSVVNMIILDDGAHFRNNPLDMAGIIYADDTTKQGKASNNFLVQWVNIAPVFVANLYNRPYLHIMCETGTAQTNITWYLDVHGKKASPAKATFGEATNIIKDPSYRVLAGKGQSGAGGTGGTIYDVTLPMTNKGNTNAEFCNFTAANDYIYVGSTNPERHWEFGITTPAVTATTLTVEYWNGTTWSTTSVTLLDNTSSGNSNTMKYSGTLEIRSAVLPLWKTTQMDGTSPKPLDPLNTLIANVTAGTVRPQRFPNNPDKYWVRFKVGDVTGGAIQIGHILPIRQTY
jgi:hypothetical protein